MVCEADPDELLVRLFPPLELPVIPEFLFYSLSDERMPKNAGAAKISKLKKLPIPLYAKGVWRGFPVMVSNGKNEKSLATFLNKVCKTSEPFFEKPAFEIRIWVADFSTMPVSGDHSSSNKKPDLVLIRKAPKVFKKCRDNGANFAIYDAQGKLKTQLANVKSITEHKFKEFAGKELPQGAYFCFGAQDDRRFLPAVGFINHVVRLIIYDRGAVVTSKPFDIHQKPLTFLHLLIGLTYSARHRLGYDTTITSEVDGAQYIEMHGKRYRIVERLWKSVMIMGKATIVWAVVDDEGSLFVLKDYWVVSMRLPTEIHHLQYAKEAGVVGIPDLADFEDVVIEGEFDTCDNNRGSHRKQMDRVHRRLLFRGKSVAIYYFKSKRELIAALIDIIECHDQLCNKAFVLHRDISLNNLMLMDDKSGRRKGIIIDFDAAKDLKKDREEALLKSFNCDVPILPDPLKVKGQSKYPSLKPAALNSRESEIREKNAKEYRERRGVGMGTQPFMACKILDYPDTVHTFRHHLESIFWVLIYMCVMFKGPENQRIKRDAIPVFMQVLCKLETQDPKLLAFFKAGILARHDFEVIIDAFTDYIRELGPCMEALHATLREPDMRNVTHKSWIAILKQCLSSLPADGVSTSVRPNTLPMIRRPLSDIPLNLETMKSSNNLRK